MALYGIKIKPNESVLVMHSNRPMRMRAVVVKSRLFRVPMRIQQASNTKIWPLVLALVALSAGWIYVFDKFEFNSCGVTKLAVRFPCEPVNLTFMEEEMTSGGVPYTYGCQAAPVYGPPRRFAPCPPFAGYQDQGSCYVQDVTFQKLKIHEKVFDAEDGNVKRADEKFLIDMKRTYAYRCSGDQSVPQIVEYNERIGQFITNQTVTAQSLMHGAKLTFWQRIFGRGYDRNE